MEKCRFFKMHWLASAVLVTIMSSSLMANITIGESSTDCTNWSGDNCSISSQDIATALQSGDVTISATSGNIVVSSGFEWSSGHTLTLSADSNISIYAQLDANSGSGGKLILEYGQGAVVNANSATYRVSAPVNLQSGQNYSTKLGSDGVLVAFSVINSATALQNIKNTLSGNFALGASVDINSLTWERIGGSTTKFTGNFDGLGHTIDNFRTISTIENNNFINADLGIFGYTGVSATIRNIGLKNVGGITFSSKNNFGTLVGTNQGLISNAYSTAASTTIVYANGDNVGGLVGTNSGTITNSFSTVNLGQGKYSVGGLVGRNSGTISNSYATGSVSGINSEISGLVGTNSSGVINNSFSTGRVTSSAGVNATYGLTNAGTVNNSFWDTQTSTKSTGVRGTGKTTQEMYDPATFVGWDSDVWSFSELNSRGVAVEGYEYGEIGYPYLTNLTPDRMGLTILFDGGWNKLSSTEQTGADGSAYAIASAKQLQYINLVADQNLSFELKNNIDLNGTTWTPIGNTTKLFKGHLDGLGHTIENLTINSTGDYQGLFGRIGDDATIKNIGLTNVNVVSTGNNIGGLAGEIRERSSITDSYVTGTVQGGSSVGGLVGFVYRGAITNSYVTGVDANSMIRGTGSSVQYAGGLVGSNNGGTIQNSFASIKVTGVNTVGGLVGRLGGGSAQSITNSYATGDVQGASNIGGLVGETNPYTAIINTYSTGVVVGSSSKGGLVGLIGSGGATDVNNSYWDTNTSTLSSSAAGLGKTTTEMKEQITFNSWDFDAIWKINLSANNGYPYLESVGMFSVPPSSSNFTVVLGEDGNYTFSESQFTVSAGTLESITITTLPTFGSLKLNGALITQDQTIQASSIANIVYTPAEGAFGSPYATFAFKVNDGTADSLEAYTVTINVTAAPVPPEVTSNPVTTATVDSEYNYALTATDADGDMLTWRVKDGTSLPEWLTLGTTSSIEKVGDIVGSSTQASEVVFDNNNIPYVAFRIRGNGTDDDYAFKATVRKFDGNSWVDVGNPRFSAGDADYISLAIDSNDVLYVAYRDGAHNNKTTVMKLDGSTWSNVGEPGFSQQSIDHNTHIAIDSNNVPYVVYRDYLFNDAQASQARVKKFVGNSWVDVGAAGFAGENSAALSIAFDGQDTPYVVYMIGNIATVVKLDGNSWTTVGDGGSFSVPYWEYLSIALDNNDVPYVTFKDGNNNNKATVKKFDGSSWANVGSAGFSEGEVCRTTMAFDRNNTPFVAYNVDGNASISKLVNGSWISTGDSWISSCSAATGTPNIALDNNGIIHIVSIFSEYGNSSVEVRKFNVTNVLTGTPTLSNGAKQIEEISLILSDGTHEVEHNFQIEVQGLGIKDISISLPGGGFVDCNLSNPTAPSYPSPGVIFFEDGTDPKVTIMLDKNGTNPGDTNTTLYSEETNTTTITNSKDMNKTIGVGEDGNITTKFQNIPATITQYPNGDHNVTTEDDEDTNAITLYVRGGDTNTTTHVDRDETIITTTRDGDRNTTITQNTHPINMEINTTTGGPEARPLHISLDKNETVVDIDENNISISKSGMIKVTTDTNTTTVNFPSDTNVSIQNADTIITTTKSPKEIRVVLKEDGSFTVTTTDTSTSPETNTTKTGVNGQTMTIDENGDVAITPEIGGTDDGDTTTGETETGDTTTGETNTGDTETGDTTTGGTNTGDTETGDTTTGGTNTGDTTTGETNTGDTTTGGTDTTPIEVIEELPEAQTIETGVTATPLVEKDNTTNPDVKTFVTTLTPATGETRVVEINSKNPNTNLEDNQIVSRVEGLDKVVVTRVEVNENGTSTITLESGLSETDVSAASSITSFVPDVVTDIEADGSVSLKSTTTNTTTNETKESKVTINTDGTIEHTITLRDANGVELVSTKVNSSAPNSNTTLLSDGTLQTRAEVLNEQTGEQTTVLVNSRADGSANHIVSVKDSNGVEVVTRATSNIKGAQTTISASGEVHTKAQKSTQTQTTSFEATAKPSGEAMHEVVKTDIATGVAISSKATFQIKGAQTNIDEDGKVETTVTSHTDQDGYITKAVVITDEEGESITKFVKELSDGTQEEIQNTLQNNGKFEAGNEATVFINEENRLQIDVITNVTKPLKF